MKQSQRKIFQTFSMLLIAVAAFLFAYFYEYVGGKQRDEKKEKSELLFTSFNPEKIVRISIKKLDSPVPLVISKKENDYHIEQPAETKAERTSVESLFNEIKNIKKKDTFSDNAISLAEVIPNPPLIEVIIEQKDTSSLHFKVGKQNSFNNQYYVKIDGNDAIFLAENGIFSAFDKSLFSLREKTLFQVEKDKIKSFECVKDNNLIWKVDHDNEWKLSVPESGKADSDTIQSIINSFSDIKAIEFASETSDQKKEFGLDTPLLILKAFTDQKTITLNLGKNNDSFYAASDSGPIIKIEESVFKDLDKSLFDVRDKTILGLKTNDIYKIIITDSSKNKSEEIIIQKDDSTTENTSWKIIHPKQDKAIEWKVNAITYLLSDVQTKEFLTPDPQIDYGFTAPKYTISAFAKEGTLLGQLLIGNTSSHEHHHEIVYVKANGKNIVFAIEKTLITSIPNSADELIEKTDVEKKSG